MTQSYKKNEYAFTRWAGNVLIALTASLVFTILLTACPNNVGGKLNGGSDINSEMGGGGEPSDSTFTLVAFGTNGDDLKNWLTNTASETKINRLEVTGVPTEAFASTSTTEASHLGNIVKESGKKVSLKLPASNPPPSLKNCFKDCTNLVAVRLEYVYEPGKFDNAFAGCTGLKAGSITVLSDQLKAYQENAAVMGVSADRLVPSSIEGVWRWITEQSSDSTVTFPMHGAQPYTCFLQGKFYDVQKLSIPDGIFKTTNNEGDVIHWAAPYNFSRNTLTSEGVDFTVDFDNGKMTIRTPDGVIQMERVDEPTVEQILAAQSLHSGPGGSSNGAAVLTLDPTHLTIKVKVETVNDSPVTVEGCSEMTLASGSTTELHANGTTVTLKGNIRILECSDNKLTTLHMHGLSGLWRLDCSGNQLTALDVQNLPELFLLNCSNNQLSVLNIDNLPELLYLSCHMNRLSADSLHTVLTSLPDRSPKYPAGECTLYSEKNEEQNHSDFTSASAPQNIKQSFEHTKNAKNWKLQKQKVHSAYVVSYEDI